jgi:hypothetical protein
MRGTIYVNKVSLVFFIFGIVIAIISPFIPFYYYSDGLKTIILLMTGLFIGLFNVTKEDQKDYLLASAVFILVVANIQQLIAVNLGRVLAVLENIAILVIPGTVLVSLSLLFDYIHIRDNRILYYEKSENLWNIVILGAVVLVFIEIILDLFFEIGAYQDLLHVLELLTFSIFIIDLIILYLRAQTKQQFFRECWLDIIATIPFSGYFRMAKVFRAIKIFKAMTRMSRGSKLLKVNKGFKLFSEKSGFNDFIKLKK